MRVGVGRNFFNNISFRYSEWSQFMGAGNCDVKADPAVWDSWRSGRRGVWIGGEGNIEWILVGITGADAGWFDFQLR